MESRFDSNRKCKCTYISEGACEQCSTCHSCQFFRLDYTKELSEFAGFPVGKGFYFGNHFVRGVKP